MDDRPIASSAKLLLVAGGTVQNTGQRWNSAGTNVTNFGGLPTLIDNVRGSIQLRGLHTAQAVSVQPIDGAGQPLGEITYATREGTYWNVVLGALPTTWYLITVSR